MNGTDWPSPAAVLQSVESEIKAILTHVGVAVPNCSSGILLVHYSNILVRCLLVSIESYQIQNTS